MARDRLEAAATHAVTELYEKWYSAMVRFASRSFGNVELAEEIVQDAFFELYKELRQGRQIGHPRAWVMRVIRRRVWRQYSSDPDDQIKHESLDILDTLPSTGYAQEGSGELAVLLSNLTHREEEAVLLRVAGLGYSEIASEMNLVAGTVGTLLSRALRKMQAAAQRKPVGQRETELDEKNPDTPTLQ